MHWDKKQTLKAGREMGDHRWGLLSPFSHGEVRASERGRKTSLMSCGSKGQSWDWSPELVIPRRPVLAAVSTVFWRQEGSPITELKQRFSNHRDVLGVCMYLAKISF